MTRYKLNTFKVDFVSDSDTPREVRDSKSVTALLRPIFAELDSDQEHFILLVVNGANAVTGYKVITSGGMAFAYTDFKLIFRAALALGGKALIVAHNHPSGGAYPSPDDSALTKKLQEACKLMDYRLLDHIIITTDRYFSFADEGRLQP